MGRKIYWKILILIIAFFIFNGCQGVSLTIGGPSHPDTPPEYREEGPPPWAPAHGYRAKHKYRYYPSSRVYYDEGGRFYFYYKDGQWRVSASLPMEIRININDYVTLEMDSDRPYEYDREVVRRYPPGQLKKKDKEKGKNKKWK